MFIFLSCKCNVKFINSCIITSAHSRGTRLIDTEKRQKRVKKWQRLSEGQTTAAAAVAGHFVG